MTGVTCSLTIQALPRSSGDEREDTASVAAGNWNTRRHGCAPVKHAGVNGKTIPDQRDVAAGQLTVGGDEDVAVFVPPHPADTAPSAPWTSQLGRPPATPAATAVPTAR